MDYEYIYKKLCIYLKNSDKNIEISLEPERGYFMYKYNKYMKNSII